MDNQNIENDIAIIGMSGVFSGARNIDEYWQNIIDGVESIKELSDEQIKNNGITEEELEKKDYVKKTFAIENIDQFSPEFFGYTPAEAINLNPQHRTMLECAWNTLESAGYINEIDSNNKRIAVFAGESTNTYKNKINDPKDYINKFDISIGNEKDFLATTISYRLNLKGPSITVQTACSTSMVAVGLACQGLLNFQYDMALAGGIRIGIPQNTGYLYQEGGTLSKDGHCRPFDQNASGTTGGDGAGMILLKRMQDALEDNDFIYAVIKSVAVGNDGSSKIGYTAPSIDEQAKTIAEAIIASEVDPLSIQYIEAHGTGTNLGDRVEINALTKAFNMFQTKGKFCFLGSVKANIGHTDCASGIAGIMKTALMLNKKRIPPLVNFKSLNKQLNLDNSPFMIPDKGIRWTEPPYLRRALVNSLGIGGTNACALLEQAPQREKDALGMDKNIFLLSAKSENALENMKSQLNQYLISDPEVNIDDVSYTLQVCRKHFEFKGYYIINAREHINLEGKPFIQTKVSSPKPTQIIFMFPGQGTQSINMCKDLYESYSVFRESMDLCTNIYKEISGFDVLKILYTESLDEDILNQTINAQPILFIIEYALTQFLMSLKINPDYVMGHSLGEYVAACVAGIFSLKDALKIIYRRCNIMNQMADGKMIAVFQKSKYIESMLSPNLSIAVINSPKDCVVSGDTEEVNELIKILDKQQIAYVNLKTSHAFHSVLVDEIMEQYRNALSDIEFNKPQIPVLSNITGTWLQECEAVDPLYWVKHMRQTVQFSQCIETTKNIEGLQYIEVGVGNTLTNLVRKNIGKDDLIIPLIARKINSSNEGVLTALGQMWLNSIDIAWECLYEGRKVYKLPLPTYPFEKKSYWALEENSEKLETDMDCKTYVSVLKPAISISKILNKTIINEYDWLIINADTLAGKTICSELNKYSCKNIYTLNNTSCLTKIDEFLLNAFANNKQDIKIIYICKEQEDDVHKYSDFKTLISCVRNIVKYKIILPIELVIFGTGIYMTPDKPSLPHRAMLTGLQKVIPQEMTNISCKILDMADEETYILREVIFGSEKEIVYRDHQKYTVSYEQYNIDIVNQDNLPIKENGTYIIVGGLGSIGLFLSDLLSSYAKINLVLTGRSNQDISKLPAEKQKIVDRIKKHGSVLRYIQADASEEEEMLQVIKTVENEFGYFHGVIFAAGIVGESAVIPLQELTDYKIDEQFCAKIKGMQVLENILAERPIDFCLILSSIASILGGYGFAAYCSANSYIDSFIRRHNSKHKIVWSGINLDAWESSQSVGNMGQYAINKKEAQKIFKFMIIAKPAFSIITAKGNLKMRYKEWVADINERVQINTAYNNNNADLTKNKSLGSSLEEQLIDIWEEMIGIANIKIYDNFFDLGGHSLLATRLLHRMNSTFDANISIKDFFNNATIEYMSKIIKQNGNSEKEIDDLLIEIESMTEDEVMQLLEKEMEDI